jgi:MIP family channel proteins
MRSTLRPLVAEFLGTFGFVFIGAGVVVADAFKNGDIGLLGIALAHALAFSVMVTITLDISGGHLNPAITFGLWVARKIDAVRGALYVAAQLAGAVLAVLCVRLLFPSVAGQMSGYGVPRVSGLLGIPGAIALEAILSLFLVSAVFGTVVSPRAPKVGGFGIGLVLLFDILVGGPLTGAAVNPARAFGPALVAGSWHGHAVYWIGPLIGGGAAGLIWSWLMPREGE